MGYTFDFLTFYFYSIISLLCAVVPASLILNQSRWSYNIYGGYSSELGCCKVLRFLTHLSCWFYRLFLGPCVRDPASSSRYFYTCFETSTFTLLLKLNAWVAAFASPEVFLILVSVLPPELMWILLTPLVESYRCGIRFWSINPEPLLPLTPFFTHLPGGTTVKLQCFDKIKLLSTQNKNVFSQTTRCPSQ